MKYRESEHVMIRNLEDDIDRAYSVLSDYVFDAGIEGKEKIKFELMTEEILRLIKQILGIKPVELWFDGNKKISRVIIELDTDLNAAQKDELGSLTASGHVYEEKGFFDELLGMLFEPQRVTVAWSLKDYQKQLKAKKDEDPLSLEAWDDLERSLLANLADDIDVTVSKKHVKMIVTKDFSFVLSDISKESLEVATSSITVESGSEAEKALDKAEEIIAALNLDRKNALGAKLVFEETIGMLRHLAGDFTANIWLEKYKKRYCLKMIATTEMDYDKKKDLLAMSTSNKNECVKGFMDKIRDIMQNGVLEYKYAADLTQTYGVDDINFGTMGIYGASEYIPDYGMRWSLDEYRGALSDIKDTQEGAEEAWDELEKSIVASLARDVLVGVKGDKVELTIVCDIK